MATWRSAPVDVIGQRRPPHTSRSTRATSVRTAMSAQRCLIAWNVPIGLPNCWRTLAYSTDISTARSATPTRLGGGQHGRLAAEPARIGVERRRAHAGERHASPMRRVGSMLGTASTRHAWRLRIHQRTCSRRPGSAARPRTTRRARSRASPSSSGPTPESAVRIVDHRDAPASGEHLVQHGACGRRLPEGAAQPGTVPSHGPGASGAPELLEEEHRLGQRRSLRHPRPREAPTRTSRARRPRPRERRSTGALRSHHLPHALPAPADRAARCGWRRGRPPDRRSSVRSMPGSSTRQAEHALADDVALDLLGAAADGLREPGQIALAPLVPRRCRAASKPGERLPARGSSIASGIEALDAARRRRAGSSTPRRPGIPVRAATAQAAVGHGAHRLDLGARRAPDGARSRRRRWRAPGRPARAPGARDLDQLVQRGAPAAPAPR